jgi:hypothetical protein
MSYSICRHGIGEVFPAEIVKRAVGQQFLQQFTDDPDGFLPLRRVSLVCVCCDGKASGRERSATR